jgi:cysteine desulfurase
MRYVYLDHAAATPVRAEVLEAMLPYFSQEFANPSAVYDLGSRVKEVLEEQRQKLARLIGAAAEEIIFTSSGAEANNLAVKGAVLAQQRKGKHLVVSAIEHHSVLNSARFLERFLDCEVTFLPVDASGLADPDRLRQALRDETVLVSIMHANNEIGTVQPLAELAAVCHEKGVLFHTDAVATVGNLPVDVRELGVDLLTLSGAALGAPKGTGALYFRNRLRLVPLIHGGIQEDGRRGGTENVPGIVGLGKAAELARAELPQRARHLARLRDLLVRGIKERVPRVVYTGHPEQRLPGHASFCIEAVEGEALLFMLSREGIYASTGSSCASKALKTSPVLVAIGIPPALAQGSLVFTMNNDNREEDVHCLLEKLPGAVAKLRAFSPVWKKIMDEEKKDETLHPEPVRHPAHAGHGPAL